MKMLWTYIQNKAWSTRMKQNIFLFLTTLAAALLGLAVWSLVQFFALNSVSWLICFTCYPAIFIGLIGGILYLYRHDF